MTEHHESNAAGAGDRRLALVEAFVDGERVDAQALKDALADAAARDHLVDLLLIRDAMGAMTPQRSSVIPTPGLSRRSPLKWVTAVAATVLLSLVAGYAAGQRVVASTVTASTVEAVLPMDRRTSAPPPTRSIAFTPGVNWTESSRSR